MMKFPPWLRGKLSQSEWTETPRPRERFTDTVAEPQGPNNPAPSERNEGKKRKKNMKIQVQ